MTRNILSVRLAGTAIAAVLAPLSSPAWAQDAASASVPPPVIVATPAAPAPTIVLPEPTAAPAPAAEPGSAPVTAEKPRATSTARRVEAPRSAAPAAAASPVREAAPAAPTATVEETAVAPVAMPEARSAEVSPVAVASPAPADTDGSDNSLALAGLVGLVGLGGAGAWLLTRRRSRVIDEGFYEPEIEPETVAPAKIAEPLPVAAPVAAAAVMTSTSAASADLTDRQAILEEMVAEPPSEENPFTTRKARMRRARLILQGREARGERLSGVNPVPTPAFGRVLEEA